MTRDVLPPKDAKLKWCPFGLKPYSFMVGDVAYPMATNRDETGAPLTMCLADACQAWRWNYQKQGDKYGSEGYCQLIEGKER